MQIRKERSDGGGIPIATAGCRKCDTDMAMLDDVHHVDGSVCRVIQRNVSVAGRDGLAPLGRHDPSRDGDFA